MVDLNEINNKIDTSLSKSERIEKGYVLSRAVLEVAGKPVEHITASLEKYVSQIEEKEYYEVEEKHIAEATETENEGIFSIYAEITFWTNNFSNLTGFCFDFMPSSIEILEPGKMVIKGTDLTDVFNDMQGRLHHVDMLAQKLHRDNQKYGQSILAISKNIIMLTLSRGPNNIHSLVKTTGIEEKALKPFVEKLIKDGFLEAEGDLYKIKPKSE